jgi:hypothetical protein
MLHKQIYNAVNQIYQRGARCQILNSLPPTLIIDRGFPDPAKLVELNPCGHRSEKNSISTAKE